MLMSGADSQDMPGAPEPAAPADAMPELVGYIVNGLFSIGLSLESARSMVGDGPAGDRIAAATGMVDRLIREIRQRVFAGHQDDDQECPGQTADRAALLQEHIARTARALQASATEYAALLQQRADLSRSPQRMDYPAEIKRWRAFADQAEQMARR
jgi:hypothetical protein